MICTENITSLGNFLKICQILNCLILQLPMMLSLLFWHHRQTVKKQSRCQAIAFTLDKLRFPSGPSSLSHLTNKPWLCDGTSGPVRLDRYVSCSIFMCSLRPRPWGEKVVCHLSFCVFLTHPLSTAGYRVTVAGAQHFAKSA